MSSVPRGGAERGIEELGASEHITASCSRSTSGRTLVPALGRDDGDVVRRVPAVGRPEGGIEADLPAWSRGPFANLLDGRDGITHRLGPLAARRFGRTSTVTRVGALDIWRGADPRRCGRAISRRSRGGPPGCSHPRPRTCSRCGVAACRSGRRPARFYERAMDGSPTRTWRWSLHRRLRKPVMSSIPAGPARDVPRCRALRGTLQ